MAKIPVPKRGEAPAELPVLPDQMPGMASEFVPSALRAPSVPESTMAAIQSRFSARGIVEILHLTGFYCGLGRLCTVLDIENETPVELSCVNAAANLSNP
jgi:hypothetical protein